MSVPAHQPAQEPEADSAGFPMIRLADGTLIPDRREASTPALSRFTLFGRRRWNTGSSDTKNYYVDWVDGHFRTLITTIAIFILVDTFCTLYIVSQGGSEANPVMNWVLQRGMGWFIGTKVAAALSGVLLLAIHRHFLVARICGGILIVTYSLVVFYHLHLLLRIWVD